jgi:hypothetical protein
VKVLYCFRAVPREFLGEYLYQPVGRVLPQDAAFEDQIRQIVQIVIFQKFQNTFGKVLFGTTAEVLVSLPTVLHLEQYRPQIMHQPFGQLQRQS